MLAEAWSKRGAGGIGRGEAGQFGLALLDQGATSFGSLALQLALVTLLAPTEFGAYAVAASIQGIAYLVLYSTLLEPIAVIGAQHAPPEANRYLVKVLAALVVASLCASAMLVAAALALLPVSERIAFATIGGAIGLPGIALAWFARRAAYLPPRMGLALASAFSTVVLLLVGGVALYQANLLSAATGLALLGFAGGLGALWPLRRLGIGAAATARALIDGSWAAIVREHRPLAGWGILNAFSVYASRDLYPPLLAAGGGLELAAVHRAASLIALPIMKFSGIFGMFVQPRVSRAAMAWDRDEIARLMRQVFFLAAILAVVAALVLWPLMPHLVNLVFRDPIYTGNAAYFWVVAFTALIFGLIDASINVILRALRRFDLIFWPAFALGLVAGILGLIGVAVAGLAGAAAALLVSTLVFVPATILACVRAARSERWRR